MPLRFPRPLRPATRLALAAALAALLLAPLGCGDDNVSPGGRGTAVNGRLVSPNGDEGAAVLELTGGGVGEITVTGGQVVTSRRGNTTRAVVVLDVPGNIVFSVRLDDPSRLPAVRVVEVADAANQVRASVAAYSVMLADHTR